MQTDLSTNSSTWDSEEERSTAIRQDRFFSFLDSFRFRMHRWLYTAYILFITIQTMLTIAIEDANWGPSYTAVFSVVSDIRTLGLSYLPYDGIVYFGLAILIIYVIGFLAFAFTYYFYSRGIVRLTDFFRAITLIIAIGFSIFPFVIIYMLGILWNCTNGNLDNYPTISCWGIPNAPWAIVALVIMIFQMIVYS